MKFFDPDLPDYLFSLALSLFNNDIRDKIITIWGLAFKPNTNDTRESPALSMIEKFLEKGAQVKAYDPVVSLNPEEFEPKHKSLSLLRSANIAAEGSDCLIICTEWKEFWNPDLKKLSELMARKLILDGRNILDPNEVISNGFEYIDIGRSARTSVNE